MGIKCINCGANVSRHDQTCSYCGTENAEYQPPDNQINVLLEKGLQAFQDEHIAEAVDCYNRIIDLDPDVFMAYFYLAAGYSKLNRPEEAIKAMEKAQAIRPGLAPVNYNLGILYKQAGRKEEAKMYFEKALELCKTNPDMYDSSFKKTIEKALSEFKRWKLF
jgi:tetratricopeptide (TPR) repeat protein